MKVLEVIGSLNVCGGGERFFSWLCEELNNRSELKICVLHSGCADQLKDFAKRFSDKIIFLEKKPGIDFSAARRFRHLTDEFQPDVVHLHLGCILTVFFAFFGKKPVFPIFNTVHSPANVEGTWLSRLAERYLVKKRRLQLIAISDLNNKTVSDFYRVQCHTIYNGVPTREFTFTDETDFEFDFITVARFSEVKNHALLIDAISEVQLTFPSVRLCLVGDGELLESIKTKVQEKRLEKNVVFLGPQNEVAPFLRKSRVFVLTSHYEGNPISILEALSCGLYVLAPKVGGIPDVINDDLLGHLVEPENLMDVVEAMKNIMKNPIKFAPSGKRAKLAEKYSMENCAVEHMRLFMDEETTWNKRN